MKKSPEQELVLAPENQPTSSGNMATIISEEAQTYSPQAASTYGAGSSMATATQLTLGRWHTDEILCPEDAHWYWFTANNTTIQSDGTLNWYRIHAGGSVDTIGRLYDASGNQVKYSNDDDGFNFNMTLPLTYGAKYYLCVTTDSNDTGVYDVRVTAIASPATSGDCCDDCLCEDLSSATTLSLNTWQSGSITTAGTAVCYRFVPSSTAWYTIHSSGSIDTMGYLLDANGNQLDTDDDDGATGRNFRMVYRLTAGQTYYLKVKGYGSATGSFSVAVTSTVYVQTVEVIPERMTLTKGNTHTLSANLYPVYATNKTHTWSSSNTNVATVTSGGVVTAKNYGTATIYATAQDGSGKNGFCLVTVPVPVSSVTVCPTETTLFVGETYTPTAIVYPDDATNKTVIWCSSNPAVATVDSNTGLVTARKAGTVVITATSADGVHSGSLQVTVKIDRVTIVMDTEINTNKVIFQSTGKVWYCLNEDNIYRGETDRYLDNLTSSNFYTNYTFNDVIMDDVHTKEYTDDEIKLLYAIDPHGVAAYVKRLAEKNSDLADILRVKDRVFKLLTDREPVYFARNENGEWQETEDMSDLHAVLSESESIFGMHRIWDDYAEEQLWEAIKGLAMTVALIVIETVIKRPKISTWLKAHQTVANGIKVFAFAVNASSGLKEAIADEVVDMEELFAGTNLEWAYKLVSGYNTFVEIIRSFEVEQIYCRDVFDRCDDIGYNVSLELLSGESYTLEEIRDATE